MRLSTIWDMMAHPKEMTVRLLYASEEHSTGHMSPRQIQDQNLKIYTWYKQFFTSLVYDMASITSLITCTGR